MANDTGGRRVLIVGATSGIAVEVARAYAERKATLLLTGRNSARLGAVADDLRVRGAVAVETAVLDVIERAAHPAIVEWAFASGGLDVALLAHGLLPDQTACQTDAEAAVEALDVNFTATVALLTHLANRFEAQRHGTIAVITSVAGDRGRRSNYVYGSAKGGLGIFVQGLRQRLYPAGVTVVTLKPGFVDTPMTAGVPKNALFSSARRAGRAIHRALEAGRTVAYVPWFWRPIMAMITALPESVFKRLRL